MKQLIVRHDNGRQETYYKSECPVCLLDKGYVRKSRINLLCRQCSGKKIGTSNLGKPGPNTGKVFSQEIRDKMSSAKQGFAPWNKGIKGITAETKMKMSNARKNKPPSNKNRPMSHNQKIKLSCSNRGIQESEFDNFLSPINKTEREKFYGLKLHTQCFERDNYTCDKCSIRGSHLNAHHLNSFAHFPEGRFDLSNLITLCRSCHKTFHAVSGNGKATPNTKEQYMSFKANIPTKKEVYILTGAPASGKSWVGSHVSNFDVLDSDIIRKKLLVDRVEAANRPLLLLTVGVSTFMKRNPQYTYKLIVIQEDELTVNARMLSRGGKVTDTIKRRIKRMVGLAKQAHFVGTSQEVLNYLK